MRVDDLSRCQIAFDQDSSLVVVVEMSESSWLAAGMLPGVGRVSRVGWRRECFRELVASP